MEQTKKTIQLHVTLAGTNPSIWRRIIVPDSINFFDLHHIIQISMGWTNSHLFEFLVSDYTLRFIDEQFEDSDSYADAKEIAIDLLLTKEKYRFKYIYDFGDHWEHSVEVEKIDKEDPERVYPLCVGGNLNCPPEDCGGISGYYNLLEILKDKKHPEYKDMKGWLGKKYDPGKLGLNKINKKLPKFRKYMKDWEE
jgi:hypothetical protein